MERFILFGTQHFFILGGGVLISALFLALAIFFDKRNYARMTAVIIIAIKIAELIYRHRVMGESVVGLLPLHLCNIVLIFSAIMMFTGSKKLFQICYFWCVGALFALITPDIKEGIHSFATFSFFATHFYVVYAIIYSYIYFGCRPTLKGYLSAFLGLNVIALIVYFINDKLGTNYLFVNRVPEFSSPISYFGEWPYYIIVVELIYIIVTYLVYFPFRARKK